MTTFNLQDFKIEFSENADETYVVNVTFDSKIYEVCCQTYTDNNYNESWGLSCVNGSGSDIYESGLYKALEEKYGDDFEYSSEFGQLQEKIEECAEAHKTENTLEAVLLDKYDIAAKSIESLFHACFAHNTSLYLVEHDDSDEVTIFCHDYTKNADTLEVLRTFESREAWEEYESELWSDDFGANGHHDFNISYAYFVAKKLGAFE